MSIRVGIVDDHYFMRVGLRACLGHCDEVEIVGEGATGAEAVVLCEEAAPDVILMDIQMPEMDGVEATRAIRKRHPEVQVIGLTTFDNRKNITAMLEAGAIGYLLKNVSGERLATAIWDAYTGAHGSVILSPEATRTLIMPPPSSDSPPPLPRLTGRERQILGLIAQGHTNHAIAYELGIAFCTARNAVGELYQKLGVSCRAEAAALAAQHGLIH